MKNAIVILLVAIALCSCTCPRPSSVTADGGAGDALARITAANRVRIGVKTDTPPFGVRTGETWSGFDIELALAVSKVLGIENIDFVPVTSADRDDKILAGEVDMVIASYTITRYREKEVDFTIPYFQDGQALLVPVDSKISSYLDLAGRKVGCVKGSTSSYYLKQTSPDCQSMVVPDLNTLMAELRSGAVEAITSDMLILIGLMRNDAEPQRWRVAGDRFTGEPYGIAIPENQSKWRDALNNALMELWENGTWQRIANAWFGPGSKYESKSDFAIVPYPR
jgi:polar amino acid transport system substrate-binding protein